MKKIFITGSTTGLGLIAAQQLMQQGHEVLFHARSDKSAEETREKIKLNVPFVIGDISTLPGMKKVAEQINAVGVIDAVIQNAGVFGNDAESFTPDGLRTMFAVNVMAPYLLSTLIKKPERMIFLSSGMHMSGLGKLEDLQWQKRPWDATQAYCDSKLFVTMITKWLSRIWPTSYVNAVDPGWVPTRMGGAQAPDDLNQGAETQAWLAVSDDPMALVSGKYFHHKEQRKNNPQADSEISQDHLIAHLNKLHS